MEIERKQWILEKECELRFEVEQPGVKLWLKSGFAELLGSELVRDGEYLLRKNGSIFSWQGCVLETDGAFQSAYVGRDTPMPLYAKLAKLLTEEDRARVMIVGGPNSGKTSLSILLTNYLIRLNQTIHFLSLDPANSCATIPGMLSLTRLERPLTEEDSFSERDQLVQFFGQIHPSKGVTHFLKQVQKFSDISEEDRLVIDTFSFVDETTSKVLLESIHTLSVTHVFVLGNERLYSHLSEAVKECRVRVVKLPVSGGVLAIDGKRKKSGRLARIKDYFYGPNHQLCPHLTRISFSSVTLWKILPDSFLTKVGWSSSLLYTILAISFAQSEEELLTANVAGFLCLREIDMTRQEFTVLSPSPGSLPNNFLLLSEIKYIDF